MVATSEAVEAALNQQLDLLQHHVSTLRQAREQAAARTGPAQEVAGKHLLWGLGVKMVVWGLLARAMQIPRNVRG